MEKRLQSLQQCLAGGPSPGPVAGKGALIDTQQAQQVIRTTIAWPITEDASVLALSGWLQWMQLHAEQLHDWSMWFDEGLLRIWTLHNESSLMGHAAQVTLQWMETHEEFAMHVLQQAALAHEVVQLAHVVVSYGQTHPQVVLRGLARHIQQPVSRLGALALALPVCRSDGMSLRQVAETGMVESVLTCLQVETLDTVMVSALGLLVALIPHMPEALSRSLASYKMALIRYLRWFVVWLHTQPDDSDPLRVQTCRDLGFHLLSLLYSLYPNNVTTWIRTLPQDLAPIAGDVPKDWHPLEDPHYKTREAIAHEELDVYKLVKETLTDYYSKLHAHPLLLTHNGKTEVEDILRLQKKSPETIMSDALDRIQVLPVIESPYSKDFVYAGKSSFEGYLCQILWRRVKAMKLELDTNRAQMVDRQNVFDTIRMRQKEVLQLTQEVERYKRESASVRDRHRKYEEEVTRKLKGALEDVKRVTTLHEQSDQEVKELKTLLEDKDRLIHELKSKLTVLENEVHVQSGQAKTDHSADTPMDASRRFLAMESYIQSIQHPLSQEAQSAKIKAEHRVSELESILSLVKASVREKDLLLESLQSQVTELSSELERTGTILSDEQSRWESARTLYHSRLNACQDKYSTLQTINTKLEERILHLSSTLDA